MEQTMDIQEDNKDQDIVTIRGKKGEHPCRQKMLQKIKEEGFEKENQILMDEGFQRPFKNLKFLKEANGDVSKAIELLKQKEIAKQEKFKTLLEDTQYGPQLKQLQDKGFQAPPKQLLRILTKFDGNIEETEKFLNTKRDRCRSKKFGCKPSSSSKSRSRSKDRNIKKINMYQEKLDILAQKGYTHPRPFKLVKLLQKFGGDIEMVMQKIDKKIFKGKWSQTADDKKKIDLKDYPEQVSLFISKGILKPKQMEKILKITGNDNEKILEILNKIDKNDEFAQKINSIMQTTNCKDTFMIKKMLMKCDGNEQQATKKILKNMEIKHLLQTQYSEQVKFMICQGVKKPKFMYEALQKSNGNQEQAMKFILELRKEKGMKYKEKFGGKMKDFPFLNLLDDFQPGDAKFLFVDGNNLLFVNDDIRKIHLKKNKKLAEQILIDLIRNWSIAKQVQTTLVFDNGSVKKIYDESNKFLVLSARPDFQTSDDLFVEKAEKMTQEIKDQSLFVTSDKGLQIRLIDIGIKKLMKSGSAFNSMKNSLGNEIFDMIVKIEVMNIE